MPQIPIQQLSSYVSSKAYQQKYKLISPIVNHGIEQKGETCKLVALHYCMLLSALASGKKVPELYENFLNPSLLEFAINSDSAVGELYSTEAFQHIVKQTSFECHMPQPFNEDQYITEIENLINANKSTIVFFDVNIKDKDRYGYPQIGDGENEHSGVIVGYYRTAYDETHFIVHSWGGFYDFNGTELALSSFQLQSQRKGEEFIAIPQKDGEIYWQSRQFYPDHAKYYTQKGWTHFFKKAKDMPEDNTPLKGQVIYLT